MAPPKKGGRPLDGITIRQNLPDVSGRADGEKWIRALYAWLSGRPANTRRSYERAIRDFFSFARRLPDEITVFDVAAFRDHLARQGQSPATIKHRLAAISSFFSFLLRPQSATGKPLVEYNPVAGAERPRVNPYERARKMNENQFRLILNQIDRSTVKGKRDYAMLLFYVLCARRRSEVVRLRFRDIEHTDRITTYRTYLKGGKTINRELPPPVWYAILDYLEHSGRTITPDSPVFVATRGNGRHLRRYYGVPDPDDETPITGQAVHDALKRYAEKAGVDPRRVTLHSLRHLGAALFFEASGDVLELQRFLDHVHLSTTQIYLPTISGDRHRHWQAMTNRLGVE